MSGDTYRSYSETFEDAKGLMGKRVGERIKFRSAVVEEARRTMHEKKARITRDTSGLYDRALVKLKITQPANGVKRVHVVLIDNSGSNAIIAQKIRDDSGYLAAALEAIDATSQVAFIYFSDHGDGDNIRQEIDFVQPGKEADKVLYSSNQHIAGANGFDVPEAIECALWEVCDIKFNQATEKHLYLMTDSVAHNMGYKGGPDDPCPHQREWRKAVARVAKTFTTFAVVGCGNDSEISELQKQFIAPERLALDFIDLSAIPEDIHRRCIASNAFLFLVARQTGMQGLEMFLSALYQKWLNDPVFGKDTDMRAQEAIRRFAKYIPEKPAEVEALMKRILV